MKITFVLYRKAKALGSNSQKNSNDRLLLHQNWRLLVCYSCGHQLHNWEQSDEQWEDHVRHISPNCKCRHFGRRRQRKLSRKLWKKVFKTFCFGPASVCYYPIKAGVLCLFTSISTAVIARKYTNINFCGNSNNSGQVLNDFIDDIINRKEPVPGKN